MIFQVITWLDAQLDLKKVQRPLSRGAHSAKELPHVQHNANSRMPDPQQPLPHHLHS